MERYKIVTFGCQMNVHESEKIAGMLESLGYCFCDDINLCDVIVFNTCAIREGAEDRALGNIGALKQLKKKNKKLIIAVGGCSTQQKEVADYIYKTFPFVDIIYGTKNLHLLGDFIKKRKANSKRAIYYEDKDIINENVPMHRTSGKNAWVNIIYGCNNFCTYCIVPYVRGRERSRIKEDIIVECKQLISEGYETITLLGQNVNSYGNDDKTQGNFEQLLKDICKLEGNFKLTFMTSHPKDITSGIIDVLANEDKMLKELHLPCQSGSNRILKLMNRRYTKEQYLSIIDEVKSKIPNIRLSSDFIVGFPTETEEDFIETCNLVKKVQFDGIFAFIYSVRKGTVAEQMEDKIDYETKNKRVNELLALQKKISKEGK